MEIVVVDDGSTVPATDILQDVDVPAPHDLHVVRENAPRGVARARNRGLAVARTPWVGFCDDDDMWAPTKAAEQILAAGSDAGWTCSSAIKVDEHLRPFEVVPAPDPTTARSRLLAANVVPGGASSVIARTEVARAVGGFDPALSALADWDFWVRLAQEAPLAVVARPLVAYLRAGRALHVHRHPLARRGRAAFPAEACRGPDRTERRVRRRELEQIRRRDASAGRPAVSRRPRIPARGSGREPARMAAGRGLPRGAVVGEHRTSVRSPYAYGSRVGRRR